MIDYPWLRYRIMKGKNTSLHLKMSFKREIQQLADVAFSKTFQLWYRCIERLKDSNIMIKIANQLVKLIPRCAGDTLSTMFAKLIILIFFYILKLHWFSGGILGLTLRNMLQLSFAYKWLFFSEAKPYKTSIISTSVKSESNIAIWLIDKCCFN